MFIRFGFTARSKSHFSVAMTIGVTILIILLLTLMHHFTYIIITAPVNFSPNTERCCSASSVDDDGWLNQGKYINTSSAYYTKNWTHKIKSKNNKGLNYLHSYTMEDVVTCIDSILVSQQPKTGDKYNNTLHFVFVGDSRARQQFYNFLKFIPGYDQEFEPQELLKFSQSSLYDLHMDRNVTYPLLGLRISYLWRPKLSDEWATDIQKWLDQPPYFILIGMGIHYLYNKDESHYDRLHPFQQGITDFLLPAFKSLISAGTQIIWMNQFNMLPDQRRFFSEWNGKITSGTVEIVNQLARRLLKKSGVQYWDSGNAVVEEYIRSCHLLQGMDRSPESEVLYHNSYFNCLDVIHPGYVALFQAMQIILNHLCNK